MPGIIGKLSDVSGALNYIWIYRKNQLKIILLLIKINVFYLGAKLNCIEENWNPNTQINTLSNE